MSEIIQTWWYTTYSGDTIGIVKTYDIHTKEYNFRIGKGLGLDENADAKLIQKTGDHFNPEEIE